MTEVAKPRKAITLFSVKIPNINIWGFHLHKNVMANKCDLVANFYKTTNTPSRARYASVYGVSHSRGGPNCLLVKDADLDDIKSSFVVANRTWWRGRV